MKDILTAPFLVEMIRTTTNMYNHGWDERNGGNVSLMLEPEEVAQYLDVNCVARTIPTGFTAPELDGRYFLVTGTGKYFKNVQYAPDVNLGIVRLRDQGQQADLLWGFSDGGQFTSEFPAHMMSHVARLKVDPKKMSPLEYAKRNAYKPIEKRRGNKKIPFIHIQDIEDYYDNFQRAKFYGMIDDMRKAEDMFGITYKLGYSNYTFELWMLLHVADVNFAVRDRSSYLGFLVKCFSGM